MRAKDVIRSTIHISHEVLTTYLGDMGDADLMLRPAPSANHIAWQLGHLIVSEHEMLTGAGFEMPPLPSGFAEAYSKETAQSDDPGWFHKKDEYIRFLGQQRDATLAALDAVPEDVLDEPSPPPMREYAPTIGEVFNMVGVHEMMHAGQFVCVRRLRGKSVLI